MMAPPALGEVQNELNIRHLCSYNVLIRSQPFRGEEEVTKNYTVPGSEHVSNRIAGQETNLT